MRAFCTSFQFRYTIVSFSLCEKLVKSQKNNFFIRRLKEVTKTIIYFLTLKMHLSKIKSSLYLLYFCNISMPCLIFLTLVINRMSSDCIVGYGNKWIRVFLQKKFLGDFIEFAYSQSQVFDKIRCPCRKRASKEFHMLDDLKLHLYSYPWL